MSAVGNILKRLRTDRGLSLREAGKLADIDYTYLSRLETGQKTGLSRYSYDKLLTVYRPCYQDEMLLRLLTGYPPFETEKQLWAVVKRLASAQAARLFPPH
jgi:transcriptional regulator with XRE-family HTH domain